MNRGFHGTTRSAAIAAALLLIQSAALAIEKPKQVPPPEAPPEAPAITVAPTDETEFQRVLQRVSTFREFRGLKIDDE